LVNDEEIIIHDFNSGNFSENRKIYINKKTNDWKIIVSEETDSTD